LRTIEIIVSPQGQMSIQTHGFSGTACREATGKLEKALGAVVSDQPTAEMYASAPEEQLHIGQGGKYPNPTDMDSGNALRLPRELNQVVVIIDLDVPPQDKSVLGRSCRVLIVDVRQLSQRLAAWLWAGTVNLR
jgi:hypothetical protein